MKLLVVLTYPNILYLYDLASLRNIQRITTPPNPLALLLLSSEEKSYLAFLGHTGSVIVMDVNINNITSNTNNNNNSTRLLAQIQAHDSSIVAMSFNASASMLVTASVTGTVIRVFSLPHGDLMHSFRRGSLSVLVTSLCFCPLSQLLAVGSASGCVHVFLLDAIVLSRRYPASTPTSTSTSTNISISPAVPGDSVVDKDRDSFSNGDVNYFDHEAENDQSSTVGVVGVSTGGIGGGGVRTWSEAWSVMQHTAFTGAAAVAEVMGALKVLPSSSQELLDSARAVCQCRLPVGEASFRAAIVAASPSSSSSSSSSSASHHEKDISGSNSMGGVGMDGQPREVQMKVVVVSEIGSVYRWVCFL